MPASSSTQDRFYGFRDLAELCEHVIQSLFSCPASASTQPAPAMSIGVGRPGIDTPPLSPTLGKEQPPPLGEFIAYALYRTRLPVSITHQALLLLSRLKARYPSARGTATSPHRLFLSSLMLSSKISMDDTYSNKSWQVVGQGLFSLREVNQMERELFAFLGWNVVVRDEELSAWVHDVVAAYEADRANVAAPPPTTAAAPSSPRKSMEDRKRRRDSTSPHSAGPLTPDHMDEHHLAPAWAREYAIPTKDAVSSLRAHQVQVVQS
ncbi:alternative cyclin Pcl12 [Pseudohyphozyma bogoriensis]|nr:alternative cyclin Pcl12 [Pseudohyphozyma bogoriensis]